MLPPAVAWIDPGDMTGIATLFNGRDFHVDEYMFRPACDKIAHLCSTHNVRLAIGWEQWTPTASTHKMTWHPDVLHVIGVTRYFAMTYGCRILEPGQQYTPKPVDQERLKAIGWWVPGKDDAQSAACHMLRWLNATHDVPPREQAILMALREKGQR